MRIDEILPIVEKLMADGPAKPVAWIKHEEHGEWDGDNNYCPDCAKQIIDWLCGGEKPEGADQEFVSIPTPEDWPDCTPDNCWVDGGWPNSYESDGRMHCGLCGCMLWVSLLEYGVVSELEHFEEHGIKDADDWRHFHDVLTGIEYVEKPGYLDKWHIQKLRDVERAQRLYKRTMKLAEKCLPKESSHASF